MTTATRVQKRSIISPHIHRLMWWLAEEVHGPMSSAEMAEMYNRRRKPDYVEDWTPSDVSNKIRSVQRLGLVGRESSGTWFLTEKGDRWIRGES